MAFYRLGSNNYRNLKYNQELWDGLGGNLVQMVSDFYPGIEAMTDGDRQNTSWLFGLTYVTGKAGKIKVVYPYSTQELKVHKLRNVNMSIYPVVKVEAVGEGFKGWYSKNRLIQKSPSLEISEEIPKFESIVEFEARFNT